jgi:hypothetical protein
MNLGEKGTARKTLIFVDKPLATAVAAKLVGVLSTKGKTYNDSIGLNWLVKVSADDSETQSTQQDIRELLPGIVPNP